VTQAIPVWESNLGPKKPYESKTRSSTYLGFASINLQIFSKTESTKRKAIKACLIQNCCETRKQFCLIINFKQSSLIKAGGIIDLDSS